MTDNSHFSQSNGIVNGCGIAKIDVHVKNSVKHDFIFKMLFVSHRMSRTSLVFICNEGVVHLDTLCYNNTRVRHFA